MAAASSGALPERRAVLRWFAVALLVVALDQWVKGLAGRYLELGRPLEVFSWFNLTLHHNPGAAFSFLSDAGGWQRWLFSAISVAMSLGICAWLYLAPRRQWLLSLGLALVLGGALGNLWDRVTLGHVVDFISVHWRGWYFPTFNLADSAITVGAACLLLDSYLQRGRDQT